MTNEEVSLCDKYRPKDFGEVVGQPTAVKTIESWFAKNRVPHAMMFVGPSGVGKTTLGRIVARKIGCSRRDFEEVNCAAREPMATARDLQNLSYTSPWKGKFKVFLLDELQSWSRASFSQQALLKILEEPPKHVYFIICTTDPAKIITAIRSRCTEVQVRALLAQEIKQLLCDILEQEEKTIPNSVLEKTVETADGSARNALKLLDKVWNLPKEEDMLEAILPPKLVADAFDLVKLLVWERKPDVKKAWKIIDGLENPDWERFRHLVLTCARKELKKGNANAPRAYALMDCCLDTWMYSLEDGCVHAIYRFLSTKD